MHLFDFYKKESSTSWTGIICMAILAGVSNCVTIFLIILYMGKSAEDKEGGSKYFILFIISTALFVFSKRYALNRTTVRTEMFVKNVRLRISDKI